MYTTHLFTSKYSLNPEPGSEEHVLYHTRVQNVQADDNAGRLRGQYEADDGPAESSAAGQCLAQADQAALADVTTSLSFDSSQTLKQRPEDHFEHHTGHHIIKRGIDCNYASHWVDLPAPIG